MIKKLSCVKSGRSNSSGIQQLFRNTLYVVKCLSGGGNYNTEISSPGHMEKFQPRSQSFLLESFYRCVFIYYIFICLKRVPHPLEFSVMSSRFLQAFFSRQWKKWEIPCKSTRRKLIALFACMSYIFNFLK